MRPCQFEFDNAIEHLANNGINIIAQRLSNGCGLPSFKVVLQALAGIGQALPHLHGNFVFAGCAAAFKSNGLPDVCAQCVGLGGVIGVSIARFAE